MMRSRRQDWEVAIATGGQEALDVLSRKPVDVAVTDMRMPGMDEAQLREEIKMSYPEVVRIIQSGQSDKEMVLKSVRPAHQYRSKPCNDTNLEIRH